MKGFEQALDLNPSAAQAAYGLGMCRFAAREDLDAAAAHLGLAARLSPRDPMKHFFLGFQSVVRSFQGRHHEACALVEESIACEPSLVFSFRVAQIALYAHAGRLDEARAVRDHVVSLRGVVHPEIARTPKDPLNAHLIVGWRAAGWNPL